MAKGGVRKGAGRPPGAKTRRTREIAEKAALTGRAPLEVMLEIMCFYHDAGNLDKAVAIAKDAAPYMSPVSRANRMRAWEATVFGVFAIKS